MDAARPDGSKAAPAEAEKEENAVVACGGTGGEGRGKAERERVVRENPSPPLVAPPLVREPTDAGDGVSPQAHTNDPPATLSPSSAHRCRSPNHKGIAATTSSSPILRSYQHISPVAVIPTNASTPGVLTYAINSTEKGSTTRATSVKDDDAAEGMVVVVEAVEEEEEEEENVYVGCKARRSHSVKRHVSVSREAPPPPTEEGDHLESPDAIPAGFLWVVVVVVWEETSGDHDEDDEGSRSRGEEEDEKKDVLVVVAVASCDFFRPHSRATASSSFSSPSSRLSASASPASSSASFFPPWESSSSHLFLPVFRGPASDAGEPHHAWCGSSTSPSTASSGHPPPCMDPSR